MLIMILFLESHYLRCMPELFTIFWEFHLCFLTRTPLPLKLSIILVCAYNFFLFLQFWVYSSKRFHDEGSKWTGTLLPSFSNSKALENRFFIKKILTNFQILYETKTCKFYLRKVAWLQSCIKNGFSSRNESLQTRWRTKKSVSCFSSQSTF